jgi:hypothetical protein
MVAELEAKGLLRIRLLEAIEKTVKESDRMRRRLMQCHRSLKTSHEGSNENRPL